MIGFISKKNVRLLKMFLVSEKLEKVILFFCVSIFLVLEYTNDLFQVKPVNLQSFFLKERLEKNFKKMKTLNDWYDWLENDFAESALNTDINTITSGDKYLFGAPRIFNIYVNYDDICMDYVLNDNFNYRSDCFPNNQSQIENLLASQIPTPSDKSLCIESDCKEFYINNNDKIIVQLPHISTNLNINVFTLEIKSQTREEFQTIIKNKLRKNGWMSEKTTRSFGIEFSVINAESNDVRTFQFVAENWLGMYFTNFRTIAGGKFINYEVYISVMLSFYMTFICLNQLKTMIECNYIYKQRYILIQISIVIEVSYVILYFLESSEYTKTFTNQQAFSNSHNQNTSYMSTSSYTQIADLRVVFVLLNFIFVPFKLFNLFAWIKNTTFFIKFANTLFRTMHGVIRLMCMLAMIYGCWVLAIFVGLKGYNTSFDTLFKAFISFFTYEPSVITQDDRLKNSMSLKSIYFIYTAMLLLMRQILYLLLAAVILNALQQAQDFEFDFKDPFQKGIIDQVGEVCRKLDKFEKQTLSFIKGKQNLVNDKIIIWLQTSHDQYMSDRQVYLSGKIKQAILKKQIKLIEFNTIQEVHEFLQYLFKLKPNLLYQSAHYFRILLDYSFNKTSKSIQGSPSMIGLTPNQQFEKPNQQYKYNMASNLDEFEISDLIAKQINQFENFLWLLKEKGATVPVLFNCRTSMSVNDKARLIKIYNHLQFSSDYFEIKNYTCLNPLEYKNLGQPNQNVNHQRSHKLKRDQYLLGEGFEDDLYENELTESENFDEYYNEMESDINDMNIEEEDTYNEDTLLNHDQMTQNNLRYSFID